MSDTRCPRLLDQTLREVTRLQPESLTLKQSLTPPHAAEMALPPGERLPGVGQWLELFAPYGSAGLFRVTETVRSPLTGRATVYLEHGMAALGDSLIFGKISLAEGTPLRDALTALLSWQHGDRRWLLGDVAEAETPAMTFERESVLAALERLVSSLSQPVLWDWDFSTAPWTLHLRPAPDTVGTELRPSRNIDAITLDLDRGTLCTRLYPVGKNGLTIAEVNGGECALTSPDASLYGISEALYQSATAEDAATLMAEAQLALNRRSTPRLMVRVSARDLSVRTKEPLDALRVGRLCRVPLPEEGSVLTERIVAVTWPDVYGRPEEATLELSARQGLFSVLTRLSRGSIL